MLPLTARLPHRRTGALPLCFLRETLRHEELAEFDRETSGDANERNQRDVELTGLDFLEVLQVQIHLLGGLLQGEPAFEPQLSDPRTKLCGRPPEGRVEVA